MMCEEGEEVFTKTTEQKNLKKKPKERKWVVQQNGLVEKWSAEPEFPWCVTQSLSSSRS